MVRDFDLSGNELLMFAVIHQSIFFRSKCFLGDVRELKELTGIKTDDEIFDTLQSLIDKELVEMVEYRTWGEKQVGIAVTKKVFNR